MTEQDYHQRGFIEGEERISSGCAICGFINKSGKRFSGEDAIRSISIMHDRSNGLGGGFAGYGIYPEYKDYYALHIFYYGQDAKRLTEEFLDEHFDLINLSKIPTAKHPKITDEPLIWRYFVTPLPTKLASSQLGPDEFVARCVIKINSTISNAYVFSSGRTWVCSWRSDIRRLSGVSTSWTSTPATSWTSMAVYPTQHPGWWAGLHPFALLDYSVSGKSPRHDANGVDEMYGYRCTLKTDTSGHHLHLVSESQTGADPA
jgi:glutamate synthase domain-containing protein 1